jgi:hypothetical protein
MVEIEWLAEMLLCFGKRYDRAGMFEVLVPYSSVPAKKTRN